MRWWSQAYADSHSARPLIPVDDPGGLTAGPDRAELAAVEKSWSERYEGLRVTAQEHADAAMLASHYLVQRTGDAFQGIDGALYAPGYAAFRHGPHLVDRLAVIVVTPASTVEVIWPFTPQAFDEWLAGRQETAPTPLAHGGYGMPDSRAGREELALAWLLRHGDSGHAEHSGLRPQIFRSYSRSVIFEAWRAAAESALLDGGAGGPDASAVSSQLAGRLRCTPPWAAWYVGWPDGQLAWAYLRRLLATDVQAADARRAIKALAEADMTARPIAVRPPVLMPSAWSWERRRELLTERDAMLKRGHRFPGAVPVDDLVARHRARRATGTRTEAVTGRRAIHAAGEPGRSPMPG